MGYHLGFHAVRVVGNAARGGDTPVVHRHAVRHLLGLLHLLCLARLQGACLGAKILWFIAIVLLGNIAMAVYMLIQLFRVKADAKIEDILLRRA